LGTGPYVLMQHTAVGKSINVGVVFSQIEGGIATPSEIDSNVATFAKLQSSVGGSYPRAKREFVFVYQG